MKKVVRNLGAVAATCVLAVTVTGCNNVIGADGPAPGIAAQVDDSKITLDDLTSVVDGICTLQESDDAPDGTSRAYAQRYFLQQWIGALINEHYADDHDLKVSPPDPQVEQAPGWDTLDKKDQDALRLYAEALTYGGAVAQQLPQGEKPDPADYDITINPKFDFEYAGADAQGAPSFAPAGDQLSVPVGDVATAESTEAPSAEEMQSLPDDQLCGKRPVPAPVAPPLPIPDR